MTWTVWTKVKITDIYVKAGHGSLVDHLPFEGHGCI